MFRTLTLLLLVMLWVVPSAAQSAPDFPTVAALHEANVPPRNLTDLARRLNGVGGIAAPPENPEPLTVGTRRTFWADNSSDSSSFQMEAELRVVGEHIYIWAERGANLERGGLQRLADEFDKLVYEQVRELWGSEASPGVDGDTRVHAVFASNLGWGVGAYYAAKHSYPIEAVPTSNEHEMMFYNLDAVGSLVGTSTITTITAHEFQHMIRANVDQNEDGWMDEGFSTFTEHYLGDRDPSAIYAYLGAPHTQLNTWTENGSRIADYGASQLWVTYLYERFGVEGLNALSRDPANGFNAIDTLAAQYDTNANELFADWVLANLIRDPDYTEANRYGYHELPNLPAPTIQHIGPLPHDRILTANPYSATYFTHDDLAGVEALTVTLDAPDITRLIPTDSPSGTPMWYSNRGDDSNMRLTYPLDLSGTQAPMLTYDIWYRIEDLWDYGYVMVSTTGGATWDILRTPSMTTDNPHFTSYGAAYTGSSGRASVPQWMTETIDLSAYAGQEVLLRFELINDDAVNREGMAIDSVRVTDNGAEVFASRFDEPTANVDWFAEGWVLTDNRLPQVMWLQAVQDVAGDDFGHVMRWQLVGADSITLPLMPDVERVRWALSPIAPTTTTPVELTLTIAAN